MEIKGRQSRPIVDVARGNFFSRRKASIDVSTSFCSRFELRCWPAGPDGQREHFAPYSGVLPDVPAVVEQVHTGVYLNPPKLEYRVSEEAHEGPGRYWTIRPRRDGATEDIDKINRFVKATTSYSNDSKELLKLMGKSRMWMPHTKT